MPGAGRAFSVGSRTSENAPGVRPGASAPVPQQEWFIAVVVPRNRKRLSDVVAEEGADLKAAFRRTAILSRTKAVS
jgi:hypothetical protein